MEFPDDFCRFLFLFLLCVVSVPAFGHVTIASVILADIPVDDGTGANTSPHIGVSC